MQRKKLKIKMDFNVGSVRGKQPKITYKKQRTDSHLARENRNYTKTRHLNCLNINYLIKEL